MKHAKTSNYKRIFAAYFIIVVLLIIFGLVISLKSNGETFSKASVFIKTLSFDKVSFSDAITKSMYSHLLYSILVLVLSGNPGGLVICGTYIGFKAFSIGTVIGLTVKCCTLKKATILCFCVFLSNIFVFPLYAMLFIMNLKYNCNIYNSNLCIGNILKDYFSYASRVFLIFCMLCISDCLQNALGILVISLLG